MEQARVTRLALDFDGVISNGKRETFVVGLRSYADLRPETSLRGHLQRLQDCPSLSAYDFAADSLFQRYLELTPLGNRAEDFGVSLLALEQGIQVPDQASYDALFAAQDRSWLDAFHRRFYEQRTLLRQGSPQEWLRLHPQFGWFVELLQRRGAGRQVSLAIVTAKDAESVRLLLEHYGISQLFPPERLLDKEIGVSKTVHITELARRLGCSPEHISFVDDKVNHLQRVAALGSRCVLAGWGFNSDREHRLAAKLGFAVADVDSAEELLFGHAGPDGRE